MNRKPVIQILEEAQRLFAERGQKYSKDDRQAYDVWGEVMFAIFQDGLHLKSAEDFARFGVFVQIGSKMVRYGLNFDKGHIDSADDLVVYSAMLRHLTNEKCYGNHAGPPCGDPECWSADSFSEPISTGQALVERNNLHAKFLESKLGEYWSSLLRTKQALSNIKAINLGATSLLFLNRFKVKSPGAASDLLGYDLVWVKQLQLSELPDELRKRIAYALFFDNVEHAFETIRDGFIYAGNIAFLLIRKDGDSPVMRGEW